MSEQRSRTWGRCWSWVWGATLLMLGGFSAAGATKTESVADYQWAAPLQLPAGETLVRALLPAQALQHLQSKAAHDVRVFNAEGAVVPFAVMGVQPQSVESVWTARYPALALLSGKPPAGLAPKSVQVHIDGAPDGGRAWVQWRAPGVDKDSDRMAAVLLDVRQEKQSLQGMELDIQLPANVLVPVSVAHSTDLLHWTELAVQGPLFRFEGAFAPSNTRLEFVQPFQANGRYVRLTWFGVPGVEVRGGRGQVAAPTARVAPVRVQLPTAEATSDGSWRWNLGFATPAQALQLQALHDNTLVPMQMEGLPRDIATPVWENLGQTLVFRRDVLGPSGRNMPFGLRGRSLRAVRVRPMGGQTPPQQLRATLELAPLQVVLLASGSPPFTLAVGRAGAVAVALDAGALQHLAPNGLENVAWATVLPAERDVPTPAPIAAGAGAWLADATLRQRVLWLVLTLAVVVLAGVAFTLLRQLRVSSADDQPPG